MSGYERNNGDSWRSPSTEIVRQDSRTSVHTTRAQNETTNTTVTHTAGFDYTNQRLILSRTKETVECRQHANITVKTIRRTPTAEELAELLQTMKMHDASDRTSKRRSGNFGQYTRFSGGGGGGGAGSPGTTAGSTASSIDTLSLRSTPKFKSHRNSGNSFKNFQYTMGSGGATAAGGGQRSPKTPTLVKIEKSSLTQSDGRKITTHVEQQRVNVKEMFMQQQQSQPPTFMPKTATTLTTTAQLTAYTWPSYTQNTNTFTTTSSLSPRSTSTLSTSSFPSTSRVTATASTAVVPKPKPILASTDSFSTNNKPLTISSLLGTSSTYPASTATKPQFSFTPSYTRANSSATPNSTGYVSPYRRTESASNYSSTTPLNLRSTAPTATRTTTITTTTKPLSGSTYVSPYRTGPLLSSNNGNGIGVGGIKDSKCISPPKIPAPTTTVTVTSPNSATSTLSEQSISKKMKLKPGRAYIINNNKFKDNSGLDTRVGTDVDVANLKKVFAKFKLECKIYTDPKMSKIQEIGNKLRTENFRKLACVVIVVLSHGNRHERASAWDYDYNIDDELVFPMMQNDTLVDKHKILFLQLCKGDKEVQHKDQKDSIMVQAPRKKHFAPNELLKCYSTFEGFVSYRTENGSYFIDGLCELLEQNGMTTDIRDIVNDVITLVKKRTNDKQVPSMTTSFTMPFVFGDYVK